jgi:predicted phage-related endonuclease
MTAVLAPVQQMDRMRYLGSSDVAALMHVSKWKTPLDVYLAKTEPEKANSADPDRARILRRGHRLEPFIVSMMVDALRDAGHQVELVAQGRRYVHPEHPFLAAEIDCELIVDGEHVNGEAKSANRRNYDEWGDAGTDQVPIYYAAQVSFAQAITARRATWVGAVFGLDDVVMYYLPADDELNATLVQTCVDFWRNHVEPRVPPAPETLVDLARLYRTSGPPPIEGDERTLAVADRLAELRAEAKRNSELQDEAAFEILAFMGESDTLLRDGKPVLTAKHQVRTLVDSRRLEREQTDIYRQYLRDTTSRPLTFKRSKKA